MQRLFLPLHRLAHWPEPAAYQHAVREWFLQRVLEQVALEGVRTVVEVGCGDGWVSHRLARRFERVVGFEINPLRLGRPQAANVLLLAGGAEHPPLATHGADLLISFDVLEHLRDRPAVLRTLATLVRPGGRMIHVMPSAPWKLLQWAGWLPDALRKQLRGATRFLAGQRRPRPAKYRPARETNNPYRPARRAAWTAKLLPRVHGEYDSNWAELRGWTDAAWRRQFEAAGLRIERVIPLGFHSPYFFGLRPLARIPSIAGLATEKAWVVSSRGE